MNIILKFCVPHEPGNFFDQLSAEQLLNKVCSLQTFHYHKTAHYMEGTSTYMLYTISNVKKNTGMVGTVVTQALRPYLIFCAAMLRPIHT
jgi:hypothetical protein